MQLKATNTEHILSFYIVSGKVHEQAVQQVLLILDTSLVPNKISGTDSNNNNNNNKDRRIAFKTSRNHYFKKTP